MPRAWRGEEKKLDFEINLIPFIDLLSTCICFLLLSVVWLQVGSLSVLPQPEVLKDKHQASSVDSLSRKKAQNSEPNPQKDADQMQLWINIINKNEMKVSLHFKKNQRRSQRIAKNSIEAEVKKAGGVVASTQELSELLGQMKRQFPDVKQARIFPQAQTSLQDIISIIDTMRFYKYEHFGLLQSSF